MKRVGNSGRSKLNSSLGNRVCAINQVRVRGDERRETGERSEKGEERGESVERRGGGGSGIHKMILSSDLPLAQLLV